MVVNTVDYPTESINAYMRGRGVGVLLVHGI